ncbi:unnamed protein product [Parajaminaea phylloscopi]
MHRVTDGGGTGDEEGKGGVVPTRTGTPPGARPPLGPPNSGHLTIRGIQAMDGEAVSPEGQGGLARPVLSQHRAQGPPQSDAHLRRQGSGAPRDAPLSSAASASFPQSGKARRTAPHALKDPAGLLTSLQAIGLATDLSADDLAITTQTASRPAASMAASSSASRQNSALSILLSRLSLLLSDLSRLIENEVKSNLSSLLDDAGRVEGLQRDVHDVGRSIAELDTAVSEPRLQIATALGKLRRDQNRLMRVASVTELLRDASKFVRAARKLEGELRLLFSDNDQPTTSNAQDASDRQRGAQSSREEALVRSAHSLQNIDAILLSHPRLRQLDMVAAYSASISSARAQVLDRMENSVVIGLRDLNASLLSSSLLAASSLGVLQELVRDLMNDLTDVIKRRVEALTVDEDGGMSSQAKSSETPQYASYKFARRGQKPNATAGEDDLGPVSQQSRIQEMADKLHSKLQTLLASEMTAVCNKIYLLQRVLSLMRQRPNPHHEPADDTKAESSSGAPSKSSKRLPRSGASGFDAAERSDDLSSEDDEGEDDGDYIDRYEDAFETSAIEGSHLAGSPTLLDEVTSILGDAPTLVFWRTLASALSQKATQQGPWLQRAPPTVLRQMEGRINHLVDVFFEKTAIWTGLDSNTHDVPAQDSISTPRPHAGPEKTLLLRSLGGLSQPQRQHH